MNKVKNKSQVNYYLTHEIKKLKEENSRLKQEITRLESKISSKVKLIKNNEKEFQTHYFG